MGYEPGPADGLIGRRTEQAAVRFFSDRAGTFDGTFDLADIEAMEAAESSYVLELRFPGRLFDRSHGEQTACNALTPGRIVAAAVDPANYPPEPKLDDAVSIGESEIWDRVQPWVKAIVTLAALYDTTGDQTSADKAVSMLTQWAEAGAIMATPVDTSYTGSGNRGAYRPSATAPILDMENAAQLGYAVFYAIEMLDDSLPAETRSQVAQWADSIVRKYGAPIGDAVFQSTHTGIWRLEGRPMLARAILAGDEASYRSYVNAYFGMIRETVNDDGAILRNANRGDRGLHYQSQGILSITAILDLVEQQGSLIPADIEASLHAAVTFLLDADRDNAVILPYASQGYNNPGDGTQPVRFYRESAEHYWWMIYYLSRFPDHDNSLRLRDFLARNDSFVRVDLHPMSTVWVPYPINCYRAYDLSEEAVAAATAYVDANFAPIVETVTTRAMDNIAVQSDAKLDFGLVSVREKFRDRNFVEYGLSIRGAVVDGSPYRLPSLSVFADYSGGTESVANIQLLRLVFSRASLNDAESRGANYLPCGDLAAQNRDTDQQLRLHFGNESDHNECILSRMGAADRQGLSAIMANMGELLDSATESQAAERLLELHSFAVGN